MDLSQYVRADTIEAARKILLGHTLQVGPPDDPSELGLKVMMSRSLRGFGGERKLEACDWLYLYAVGEVIRGGSKLIRPSPELMRVLGHVELNISLDDYAQPYPGVGVIVPGSLYGGKDCLAVCAWGPCKGITMSCQANSFQHWTIGPNFKGILEDAFIDPDEEENEDSRTFDRIFRAILNLNLFALEKGVRILPQNPQAEKRRRMARHDDRMARLVARDAQEIVIQDLDLILRPPTNTRGENAELGGHRQRMHRRRGHWKMQAFGPGRTQRKRIYVHSYLIHADDNPNGEVHTVLS